MKVTSLKDMDSYIYSTVILPLKELQVEPLRISSPMTDTTGNSIELVVRTEETSHRRYAHNFQRDEARNNALSLVMFRYGTRLGVLADYEPKKHYVNVYAPAFERFENGKLLMNKLLEAFGHYTPFTKVTIKSITRDMYQGGENAMDVPDEEEYDDD